MIPSQSLLDTIQAKEFVYIGENKRSGFYRKKGGVRRVSVRKLSYLSEEHSSQVLGEVGYSRDEIRDFLNRRQA